LCSIIPIAASYLFLYTAYQRLAYDQSRKYSEQVMKQVANNIESVFLQTHQLNLQIVSLFLVSDISALYDLPSLEEIPLLTMRMERYLSNLMRSYPQILNTYVISADRRCYSSNPNKNLEMLLAMPWVDDVFSGRAMNAVSPLHKAEYTNLFYQSKDISVLSFVNSFYNGKDRVSVVVDLNARAVMDLIEGARLGDSSELVIVDGEDTIVLSGNEEYLTKPLEQFEAGIAAGDPTHLKIDYKLKNVATGMNYWRVVGYSSIRPTVNRILLNFGATAALVILISLLISLGVGYSITRWILRPIYQVILAIDRMDQGDKRGIETLEIHNSDINPLAETLKKMVANLDMLMERTVKQRVEMTQAQLIALRAQISPHFIYNTLETIRSYSLEYGVRDIDEMAASLARIIRYALRDGEDRVVLREELNYVKNYVRIQQYRFANRFDMRFDIPEELMDVAVPRLIIQPLVENAIVHGVEPVIGRYLICVAARREGNDMVVEVRNDGKAMSQERLRQVRDALSGRENELSVKGRGGKQVGIGLLNVHSRLRLLYGDSYGLQADSDEHLTVIRLTLPICMLDGEKDGN